MFAVIKTGGKQYRVSADDLIEVEKLAGESGTMIEFPHVLMVGGEGDPSIGAPYVDGALVTAEIVEQGRGPKVYSFKKRRRQNSKRIRGHRQLLTTLRISEILTGGAKPKKAAARKPAKAEKPAAETKGAEAGKADKTPAKAEKPAAHAKDTKTRDAKAETAEKAPAKSESAAKKDAKASSKQTKATPAKGKQADIVDDLSLIGGVGPALKKKLEGVGITSLRQLAEMSAGDMAKLDEELKLGGRTERDEWGEQARELLAGKPPRAKTDRAAAKKADK